MENDVLKGTTPMDFSQVGDEIARFFKRLNEPGGEKLFAQFVMLNKMQFPNEMQKLRLSFLWRDNKFSLREFPPIEKLAIIKRIEESIKVDDWAKDLILAPEFMLLPQETPEQLLFISPRELGVTDGKIALDSFFRMLDKISGITHCTPLSALMTPFELPLESETTFFGVEPLVIPNRDKHEHILRISNGKLSAVRVSNDRFISPDEKILIQVL